MAKIREKCPLCVEEGAEAPSDVMAKGLCSKHYQRQLHGYGGPRKPRSDTGFAKSPRVTRLCDTCGANVTRREKDMRNGVYCTRLCYQRRPVEQPEPASEQRPARKSSGRPGAEIGTRRMNDQGYIWLYVGVEEAQRLGVKDRGWVLEHRYVMAQHLGRPITAKETVHHGPQGKTDNSLGNLELWTGRHPRGQRAEDVVAYAREMLGVYGDDGERTRYAVESLVVLAPDGEV